MPYPKLGRKKSKVSYFSHEYIAENHGDIVSFVAMLVVIGLIFQITAPVSKLFIILQHNVTINGSQASSTGHTSTLYMYTVGKRDLLTCLFYSLIAIVIHAVVQDCAIDRLTRRLHLSRSKLTMASESGHLVLFYFVSCLWGANIVYRERLLASLTSLWEGYPHVYLSFWFKFYFICQICYWLHCFPELYFQRVKSDEVPHRLAQYAAHLACIGLAYLLNLNRIAVLLLVLHYSAELLLHSARLLRIAGTLTAASCVFALWDLVFVAVRLLSVALACLTFVLGLERSSRDRISIREGNFNTKFIRLNCLSLVCLLQGYQMWNFITFHVRRAKDFLDSRAAAVAASTEQRASSAEKSGKRVVDTVASTKNAGPSAVADATGSINSTMSHDGHKSELLVRRR